MVKPFLNIVCITFLLLFTAEVASQTATLADAKIAIRTQNFDKAVSILKPLAKKGDKEAQYQLAVMYGNGQGTAVDPAKAAEWMLKSARQGYERAQYSMGVLYEEGAGVKIDRSKAVYWYSVASKKGHNNAKKRLKKIQSGESEPALIDNARNPEEALVHAVSTGNVNAAEQLLAKGVSANTRNKFQCPVLLEAVAQKDSDMVKMLIKHGADVNAADKYKDRPLLVAASLGETVLVRTFIGQGAKLNNKDANGNTALMLAAAKGHDAVVTALLAKKAALKTKNLKGETAIMLADKGKHKSTVKLLKKHGARLPVAKKEGLTVNQKLVVLNNSTTGVYNNWSPLMIAVWRGQLDVTVALLKKGADPNQLDHEGHSPLSRAALQGHDKIVNQLIIIF